MSAARRIVKLFPFSQRLTSCYITKVRGSEQRTQHSHTLRGCWHSTVSHTVNMWQAGDVQHRCPGCRRQAQTCRVWPHLPLYIDVVRAKRSETEFFLNDQHLQQPRSQTSKEEASRITLPGARGINPAGYLNMWSLLTHGIVSHHIQLH